MRACRELTETGMIAYDLGASIGYITLLLAKLVGEAGRVFAFEAHPKNVTRLTENISMNDFGSRVTIVPAAVTASSQPIRFFSGPSSATGKVAGSAGRENLDYRDEILVDGISIDDFVFRQGNPAPQIIKMDIEGGEVLALPGMFQTLKEVRPTLLIELHGGEAAQTAWQMLTDAGYRLCRINPGFPRVVSLEALGWKAYLAAFPEAGE
jgi:FkbM family methyltransferase